VFDVEGVEASHITNPNPMKAVRIPPMFIAMSVSTPRAQTMTEIVRVR